MFCSLGLTAALTSQRCKSHGVLRKRDENGRSARFV
jgi:hypothetical protein